MIFRLEHISFWLANIKLALLHGTVWMILFWVSGYPLEEWAVASLMLFLPLLPLKEVIISLSLLALRRLVNYGKRIAAKAGAEQAATDTIDAGQGANGGRHRLLFAVISILLFAAVWGASISVGAPVLVWVGLSPLAPYFNWIGWALLVIGSVGLAMVFAMFWLVFATMDSLLDGMDELPTKRVADFGAISERLGGFAGIFAVR